MSAALLEIQDLEVRYGSAPDPAVAGVGFSVLPGECVAFVGETGSGKTSSVLASVGLLDDGRVTATTRRLGDTDLGALRPAALRELRRDRIGMVFQDPTASWNPTRTIVAQLLSTTPRKDRRAALERLVALCDRVGIRNPSERVHALPHQLSGGMLQRFMIAGALLHDPVLLVADEPTSALDTSVQADLLALLEELREERRLGMLLVSHDLGVVARMAQEVLVLYAGRVVEQGAAADVVNRPEHPYTRSLLAASLGMTGPRKVPTAVDTRWDPTAAVDEPPVPEVLPAEGAPA